MLEYRFGSKRISFGKKIIITDGKTPQVAVVKNIIVDPDTSQIFIVTDSILVVCRYTSYYRGMGSGGNDIQINNNYVFVGLPDTADFIMAYFMIQDIPVYRKQELLSQMNILGYTLIKDTVDS